MRVGSTGRTAKMGTVAVCRGGSAWADARCGFGFWFPGALRNPVGYEDVDFVRRLGVAIRNEDQLFAVRRKLREGAESAGGGNALNVCAVESDGVELELAGAQVLVVRGKNNSPAVGEK